MKLFYTNYFARA